MKLTKNEIDLSKVNFLQEVQFCTFCKIYYNWEVRIVVRKDFLKRTLIYESYCPNCLHLYNNRNKKLENILIPPYLTSTSIIYTSTQHKIKLLLYHTYTYYKLYVR